ncbi:MAG: hypothetical protein IJP14_04910 [Clostridia bacterium]|nr:hypothetical protein [Clostridia bacterium]
MKQSVKRFFKNLSILCVLVAVLCAALPVFGASAAEGTTYYVAVNGTGDGKSEDAPMSLEKANATTLNGGDSILFRRGDTFYGHFEPSVGNGAGNKNRVDIGAYGTGELPIFSNAKIISSAWTKEGDFYSFDLSKNGNYAGVKTDNANVGYMEDGDGVKHGIRCKDAASCANEYDFYCDHTANKIYVKSTKDPYEALGTLLLNTHDTSMFRLSGNMNVHDIHFRDCGYGISWKKSSDLSENKNVSVYDCVFDNIGGNIIGDVKEFIKAGNAIEFYSTGSNVLVEKNLFRDVYDVAFTLQGNTPGNWRDVTLQHNVFVNNTQAIEFWCGGTEKESKGIVNFVFNENICLNQGEGWGTTARPNKFSATDVLAYGYTVANWQMTITNNTFFHLGTKGAGYVMPKDSIKRLRAESTIDNNHYYFPNEGDVFARWENTNGGYSYTFEEWKKPIGAFGEKSVDVDKNSTMTAVGNGDTAQRDMIKIAASSLDFDEIVNAVKAAGVYTPIESSSEDTTTTTEPDATDEPTTPDATDKPTEGAVSPWIWVIIAVSSLVSIGSFVLLYILVIRQKKSTTNE